MSQLSNGYANFLLHSLSEANLALLTPHLQRVSLPVRMRLEHADQPVEAIYFIESGIASTVNGEGEINLGLEVGLVGREGVTGVSVILADDQSPNSTFMQMGGDGYKMRAEVFREVVRESETLRSLVLRFAQVLLIQATQTIVVNRQGRIEERLARWLLMAHDRSDGPVLPLTHEFLSIMLGVRRSGVTDAIHELEAAGLIKPERAQIRIVDRSGLIDLAQKWYGTSERAYQRVMGISIRGNSADSPT